MRKLLRQKKDSHNRKFYNDIDSVNQRGRSLKCYYPFDVIVNYAKPYVGEKENHHALRSNIHRTHHVYFQRFLQSCHTLCRYQRM
jgi:hypothetical protein